MGSRRKAREVALQVLYLCEFDAGQAESALNHFWRPGELDERDLQFTRRIVQGVLANREAIDSYIVDSSEHWRLDRMAMVDRNILRLAVYEFLFMEQTPKKVIINEAIEIAKRFSTEESTQFINGVLDSIRKRVEARAS